MKKIKVLMSFTKIVCKSLVKKLKHKIMKLLNGDGLMWII